MAGQKNLKGKNYVTVKLEITIIQKYKKSEKLAKSFFNSKSMKIFDLGWPTLAPVSKLDHLSAADRKPGLSTLSQGISSYNLNINKVKFYRRI